MAVVGVIAMVALSPRPEGFFPGMFDFLKRASRAATIETGTIYVPEYTAPTSQQAPPQEDSLDVTGNRTDTLPLESQRDTVSIE